MSYHTINSLKMGYLLECSPNSDTSNYPLGSPSLFHDMSLIQIPMSPQDLMLSPIYKIKENQLLLPHQRHLNFIDVISLATSLKTTLDGP